MPANPTTHPSADTLQAYGLATLDHATAESVERHLEMCAVCRQTVAAMSGGILVRQLRAAHAAAAPPPIIPPKLREQYDDIRELGRGGMGVVYLARNRLMDRPEVLKLVSQSFLDHPEALERFLREIRAAARLSHPNIVTAYAALQFGELLVLAMEYVEGENLARVVQARGPLPVGTACHYVQQAAMGLQHACEKGMVHRDIKPHNLMLARDGKKHVVKIFDFGLAKATRENEGAFRTLTAVHPRLTALGVMMGTPDYIAPEQIVDAAKSDIRADIYSLGCTLYFLLTGRPPFRRRSVDELLQAHVVTAARPLNEVRNEAPAELAAVVARMMAKDPAHRYQKPVEVARALTQFVKAGLKPLPFGPVPAEGATREAPSASAATSKTEWAAASRHDTAAPVPMLRVTLIEDRPRTAPAQKPAEASPPLSPSLDTSRRWVAAGLVAAGVLLLAITLGLGIGGPFKARTREAILGGKVNEPNPDPAASPVQPKKGDDQPPVLAIAKNAGDQPPVLAIAKNAGDQPPPVPAAATHLADQPPSAFDLTGGYRFVHYGPNGPRVVLVYNDDQQHFARVYNLSTGEALTGPLQHDDVVYHAAFSPDGTRVVTASFDKTAKVWDATGKEVAALKHRDWVRHAAFSPDGKRVVTASGDKTARVWDVETGDTVVLKHGHWVIHAMFSPNGERVVTASWDKTAKVWDLTGKEVTALKHQDAVAHATFSPDGTRVVTASRDKTARVWDAATGESVIGPLPHDHWVIRATFSADGRRVATASFDRTVRVWNKAIAFPKIQHDSGVSDATFSPDGKWVVTASVDDTAWVCDAVTGKPLSPPLNHDNGVDHATFSPDGTCVITASRDNTARLWDANKGTALKRVTIALDGGGARTAPVFDVTGGYRCVHFGPKGPRVVLGGDKTQKQYFARVYDLSTGQALTGPLKHDDVVYHAAFSPDGKRVVTASRDKTAQVWDAATGETLTPPLRHNSTVNHASFSPDGKRVVTASDDKTAKVWDAATGDAVITGSLQHDDVVRHATFSPDGTRVVTASWDRTARVRDAATGHLFRPPLKHGNFVIHAMFSPDGKRMATATMGITARVWDLETGQNLALRHERSVNHVAFSLDGKYVVTACIDGTARVWDAATGLERTVPLKHNGSVDYAIFCPDGKRLVTASCDKTARVWDAATGKPVTPPLMHNAAVYHATFSPDGQRVVTVSEDKTARLWDATNGEELKKVSLTAE